jgi:hypothetical protein
MNLPFDLSPPLESPLQSAAALATISRPSRRPNRD